MNFIKNLFSKINAAKTAVILLGVYAAGLTVAIAFAVTIGPFKGTADLLVKNRLMELDLQKKEDFSKALQAERDRLLMAVRNLQSDAEVNQASIAALKKNVNRQDAQKDLAEANRMVENLNKERRALLLKLDELRGEIQRIADARAVKEGTKVKPETSDLVTNLEKEKADLQAKIQRLEGALKK